MSAAPDEPAVRENLAQTQAVRAIQELLHLLGLLASDRRM